ncbi:Global transcription regulator sge1 [Coemansia sp. RSA 1935]|nr:Global transcription regulator sge1 [Coemansia sp. RSA 1935]
MDTEPVLHNLDMSPEDVVIGGPSSCVTVTGLKVMTTRDALTIFEACRQGILPRVVRRLTDSEKQQIREGTVVVFDEKQAKMKRWTDGRIWTPSRILGNFLVYRELDRKVPPNHEGVAEISRLSSHNILHEVHSSNKGLFFCKPHGLIKRTISLAVPDCEQEFLAQREWRPPRVHQQHLVAYFRAETALMLPTPDDMEELRGLRLPLPVLRIQRFRRPVKIEMFEDCFYDVYDTEDDEEGDERGTQDVADNTEGDDAPHRAMLMMAPALPPPQVPFAFSAPLTMPLALQPPDTIGPPSELPYHGSVPEISTYHGSMPDLSHTLHGPMPDLSHTLHGSMSDIPHTFHGSLDLSMTDPFNNINIQNINDHAFAPPAPFFNPLESPPEPDPLPLTHPAFTDDPHS